MTKPPTPEQEALARLLAATVCGAVGKHDNAELLSMLEDSIARAIAATSPSPRSTPSQADRAPNVCERCGVDKFPEGCDCASGWRNGG